MGAAASRPWTGLLPAVYSSFRGAELSRRSKGRWLWWLLVAAGVYLAVRYSCRREGGPGPSAVEKRASAKATAQPTPPDPAAREPVAREPVAPEAVAREPVAPEAVLPEVERPRAEGVSTRRAIDAEPMVRRSARIHSIAYSPSGDLLAAGQANGAIVLWSTATGAPIRVLQGHTRSVTRVLFSPDGKSLVSSARDGAVQLWEVERGRTRRTIQQQHRLFDVALSADGKTLAGEGPGHSIQLTEVATGRTVRVLKGHRDGIDALAFSPDGKLLVSGGHDRTLRFWDVTKGRSLQPLRSKPRYLPLRGGLVFSPDGRLLAVVTLDGTVELWDLTARSLLRLLKSPPELGDPLSFAFSPDGKQLVVGTLKGQLGLWEVGTGALLHSLRVPDLDATIWSVAFHPDGRSVASAGKDKRVRLWDLATRSTTRLLGEPPGLSAGSAFSVALAPDGKTLAVAHVVGPSDGTVRLWDMRRGAPLHALRGHGCDVDGVAFSPDGKIFASISFDEMLRLWAVESGKPLQTLSGERSSSAPCGHTCDLRHDWGSRIAFTPDGKTVAAAFPRTGVLLWEVFTGKKLHRLSLTSRHALSLAFSPDGKHLLGGISDGKLELWEVATGQSIRSVDGEVDPKVIAFSPDGTQVAFGGRKRTGDDQPRGEVVRLWEIATGKTLHLLKTENLTSLAFSPSGRMLASGGEDRKLVLTDAAAGTEIRSAVIPGPAISSLAFVRTGVLVIGALDGTTTFWDPASSRALGTLVFLDQGWFAFSGERYRFHGDLGQRFWYAAGLKRSEPGDPSHPRDVSEGPLF